MKERKLSDQSEHELELLESGIEAKLYRSISKNSKNAKEIIYLLKLELK